MANGLVALAIYATAGGRKPFQEWVESLKDYEAKARVFVRLGASDWAILAIASRWAMAFPSFASKSRLPGVLWTGGQNVGHPFVWRQQGHSTQRHRGREEILAGLQEQETCREACRMTIISSSFSRTAAERRHTSTRRWRRTIRACFCSLCGTSHRPEE